MSNLDASTYMRGFGIKPREISRGEFVQMIREIEQQPAFLREEIKLAPEPITEGGIEFVSWKGKTREMYKTLRLPPAYDWPWIKEPWSVADQEMITLRSRLEIPKRGFDAVFLKAFHSAPTWKREELNAVAQVFEKHGFKISALKTAGATLQRADVRHRRAIFREQKRRVYKTH